jgi:AcrR family transcriptional regulator
MENEKQIQIINHSKSLFFKYGIKKVSVEEISSLCGISKKTFYQEFKNKYVLAEAILDEFASQDKVTFDKINAEEISFKDKIIKLTEASIKRFELAEPIFFQDVMENCKELKEYVSRRRKEDERDFFLFVSEEQRSGNLRSDIPASLISFLLKKNATDLIFDPEVEKVYPKFKKRVSVIVDCIVNGIDNGNSS